jgi:O-antigen/teichoic acid export membrane protein
MHNKITNIAKNTSYFTFALILQKVISFAYFAIIARAIGPEDLGKYYFAISFTTIFAIFIDIGLSNVLTREVAKQLDTRCPRTPSVCKSGDAQNLLSSVLAIKIPLAVLSLLAAIALVNIMGYPEITRHLVYLSSICMVLDSFTLTFFAISRGFHNLIFESIASVIFQLIALLFGLTALHFNLGLRWLMGAMVAASVFNFCYSAALTRWKWKIKLFAGYDKALIKSIAIITVPFGLFAIFQRIYTYLDSVLLSVLAGDLYVGYYQIAFKIVFALQFLPMAFTASLYPAFASYWARDKEQLVVTFERAMNYLIIISLPISIGTIALSDKIILLFKSEYMEAILPLQIIMAALFFIFINFPIGSLLNACDRQKVNTINMGAVLTVSVIMNLLLIPFFQKNYQNGALGASITVVATNFLMFLLGMRWVSRIIRYRPMKIIATFLKAVASVFVMLALILFLKPILNIFIIIPLAGMAYFSVLFLLGGFRKEDIASIWQSFRV